MVQIVKVHRGWISAALWGVFIHGTIGLISEVLFVAYKPHLVLTWRPRCVTFFDMLCVVVMDLFLAMIF